MKQFINFFDLIFLSARRTNIGFGKALLLVSFIINFYLFINALLVLGVFFKQPVSNNFTLYFAFSLLITILLFSIRYLRKKDLPNDIEKKEFTKEEKMKFNITLVILGLIPFILGIIFALKYVLPSLFHY